MICKDNLSLKIPRFGDSMVRDGSIKGKWALGEKVLHFTTLCFHSTYLLWATLYAGLPEKVLAYAYFPNVMINRDPFTFKIISVGTISYMATHLLSPICSFSVFTECGTHSVSTVCLFEAKDRSIPECLSVRCVRTPWFANLFPFLTNSTLSAEALGEGLLCSARPRRGALGKNACCLFCGDGQ